MFHQHPKHFFENRNFLENVHILYISFHSFCKKSKFLEIFFSFLPWLNGWFLSKLESIKKETYPTQDSPS